MEEGFICGLSDEGSMKLWAESYEIRVDWWVEYHEIRVDWWVESWKDGLVAEVMEGWTVVAIMDR